MAETGFPGSPKTGRSSSVPNVIGFQGILRYKVEPKGSSLAGTELEPLLSSSDPNFRPTDVEVGPDGAIYFLDWHNPIIGHMQHNLRDPSRDHLHGRIYRVTAEGRATQPVLKLDKAFVGGVAGGGASGFCCTAGAGSTAAASVCPPGCASLQPTTATQNIPHARLTRICFIDNPTPMAAELRPRRRVRRGAVPPGEPGSLASARTRATVCASRA